MESEVKNQLASKNSKDQISNDASPGGQRSTDPSPKIGGS
jgi:hypothetical protein